MNRRSEPRIVILGTLLALCSSGPFYVVPNYLATLQSADGFSLAQLGYVSGFENLAICVACTATGATLAKWGRRTMLAAGLMCVVGNLLTIFATDYPAILGLRALTGLVGEGPLYAMSYAVLGSAANPDRAFGIGVGSVAVWAALVLFAEAWLSRLFGPAAVLVPYAAVALGLLLLVALTRPVPRIALDAPPAATGLYLRVGAMVLSVVLWSAAGGAFWAFTGTAANVLGVQDDVVTHALTIALIAGLGGLVIPVAIGSRLGRTLPLLVATAGLAFSSFLFFSGSSLLQLATALSILQVCWDIASVYQLAGIATLDEGGRYSAFGAVAQITGMAAGPAVSGVALGRFGYGFLPSCVTIVGAGALLLFAFAGRRPNATVRVAEIKA